MSETAGTLGPYVVVRRLGAGGMGEVWLARDPRLEREVALKTLPAAIARDPVQLARFRREALSLAAVNHPNIATLHGLETLADGALLLVMEHVDGITLAERLRGGPLPADSVVRIGAQIAEALEVAHERGVVHRDLKPGNVMLGPRGIVKVLDFGLARTAGADTMDDAPTIRLDPAAMANPSGALGPLTLAGEITGTPGYMSPEQAGGLPQDARTDMFALGCVLYECLSGQRAFRGDTPWETLERTRRAEVDLARLPADVAPPLRELVAHCLARAPEGRPASMREIRERLAGVPDAPTLVLPAPPPPTPHNLPRALTTFVGRATELAGVEAAFAQARLLTLTGVGGCGKTRLALELATRRLGEHRDGVWFADLARVADPERVPEVVAEAAGVRPEAGRSLVETLESHFAPRQSLLVLDNCEHVLEACSGLAMRLLGGSAGLRILATSREGLGVPGELLQGVPSLGLPPREADTLERITGHDAVRLFLDRAQVAAPGFTPEPGDAAALAEICRRLDGIPLALELAAARVRVLSLVQIRDRLDDRFRLLTGGSRTALPRHQTLRAALQWSWDQLLDPERELLRTLAVFAGGWTFESVAAVTPAGQDEFEVLDLLGRLVDKSLVAVERPTGGPVRYRFLESVRQFALERLDESGDGPALRARHLEHFLALAEVSEAHLTGPAQAEWFATLEVEQENLLAALATTESMAGGATLALRLAGSVWRFWSARGHYELGRRALERALALPGAEAPTPERARALVRAGGLALYQGDWDAAQPLIERSLELYRALDDAKGIARALSGLAIVATYREDDDFAERTNRESLELYTRLGEARGRAVALHNLGYLAWCRGEHERARASYEEALALLEQVGDREMQALSLAGLAEALLRAGDPAGARRRYAESLLAAKELRARREAAYALEGVADLAVGQDQPRLAARLLGAAAALRQAMGSPPVPREQRERDRALEGIRAAIGEDAATELAAGRGLGFEGAVDEALAWLRPGSASAPTR